jgi:hypothetical protein
VELPNNEPTIPVYDDEVASALPTILKESNIDETNIVYFNASAVFFGICIEFSVVIAVPVCLGLGLEWCVEGAVA